MALALSLAETRMLRVDSSKYPLDRLASLPSANCVVRSHMQAAVFATTKVSYLKCSVLLKPWTASVAEPFYQTCVDANVAQAHSGRLQVNSYVTLLVSPCIAKTERIHLDNSGKNCKFSAV